MIKKFLSRSKKYSEQVKYNDWVTRFSERIMECTNSKDAVKAELECWPFIPDEPIYNWRDANPVDAANEALSYYGD